MIKINDENKNFLGNLWLYNFLIWLFFLLLFVLLNIFFYKDLDRYYIGELNY